MPQTERNGRKKSSSHNNPTQVSAATDQAQEEEEEEDHQQDEMTAEKVPWFPAMTCYIQYAVLLSFGHLRNAAAKLFGISRYESAHTKKGFSKLMIAWENFYTIRLYHRIQDVFNRPICSAPGAHIDVVERYSPDGNKTLLERPGKFSRCLNLGSYNYLGFADDWMNTCAERVLHTAKELGLAMCSPSMEFGTTTVHQELEQEIASFIGKPAAVVYNMGFGTNSTTLPALMGKGSLIISDSLNHSSIVSGARASGAVVTVFRHNDPVHLAQVLRKRIAEGQPRTHRPWRKILVIVEGIYSMEGEIVRFREVVDVCKKYRAYVFVDEAHSIGALGKTGRGICEYTGVDPSEVDIMMGTFTKSFGGMGGYIAASEEIIAHLRHSCAGTLYSSSMSPVVAQQILTSLRIIDGKDGTDLGRQKLDTLRENSNYFRQRLMDMGCITLGEFDSPVIPVMLFSLSKISAFSRQCLERNLAVVTVGFPATPLLLSRVRFCISAAHTREDLDAALTQIEEVSKNTHIRFAKYALG